MGPEDQNICIYGVVPDMKRQEVPEPEISDCNIEQDDCPAGQSCQFAITMTWKCLDDPDQAKSKLKARQGVDLADECTILGDPDGCPEGEVCVLGTSMLGPGAVCEPDSESSPYKRDPVDLEARQGLEDYIGCQTSADCPFGTTCTSSAPGQENVCLDVVNTMGKRQQINNPVDLKARQGAICHSDNECPDGQVCVGHAALIDENHWCEDESLATLNLVTRQFQECETHADCAAGQSCQPGSGRSDIASPTYCMTDEAKRDLFTPSRA